MSTTIRALAYHLTWTTYGTWLSGDARGWVKKGHSGIKSGDVQTEGRSRAMMAEFPVVLTSSQRTIVEDTIGAHCEIRKWRLRAVNARTTHVHVVITANCDPDEVINQLKAWCSRKLSDAAELKKKVATKAGRRRWFTEGGNKEIIHDEDYLRNAIRYVLDGQ